MKYLKIIGWISTFLILLGIASYQLSGIAENEVAYGIIPSGKAWDLGPHCKIGLKPVTYTTVTDQETCEPTSDAFVCTPCGNDTCEGGRENFCNCPADCKPLQ